MQHKWTCSSIGFRVSDYGSEGCGDPSSAESVANLESVLEETDSSVHVTGALRGGSEKLEDMKYLTIRNLCKEYKIPHYYEMNKAQMIESIKKAQLKKSKATAPKGSKINELYISDEAPETLIEGKKILVVVVLDGDKLIIGNSKEFFSMKNEVASLILNAME